jgi:hypothetical protein
MAHRQRIFWVSLLGILGERQILMPIFNWHKFKATTFQVLLDHTKSGEFRRYPGIEVEDALEGADQTDTGKTRSRHFAACRERPFERIELGHQIPNCRVTTLPA